MNREEKIALVFALREKARRDLLAFTKWTKPDYQAGWFHRVVSDKLNKFLDDVENKRSPRLMLFAPPRSGKSELISRRFPAYILGRNPDMSIIATSYGSDLASSMNRDVQRVIDSEEYHELFPETKLSRSAIRTITAEGVYLRNSDIFEVVGHKGVYKSAGVGSGVTGRGGHVVIVDDAVKDAADAASQVVRDSTWNWYTSTLYTRLTPGGGILIVLTRWHSDDLAGRLIRQMERGGEQWEVCRFPAIAEEDEEFRKKGEPLHPERYSLDMLNAIRLGTSDEVGVGSRVWAALYQQRPSAAEGTVFKREWWKYYRPEVPGGLRMDASFTEMQRIKAYLQLDEIIQYWDTAAGGKEHNDYTACVTLGISKNRYCVLNVWKDKIEFPEVKRAVQQMYDKWKPTKVYVEGGGSTSGKSAIQELKRDTRIPFDEVIHSKDKVFRANMVSPTVEAGLVHLPENEAWVADFIESVSTFPNATNDDDTDAFIGALEVAISKRVKKLQFSDELRARIGA